MQNCVGLPGNWIPLLLKNVHMSSRCSWRSAISIQLAVGRPVHSCIASTLTKAGKVGVTVYGWKALWGACKKHCYSWGPHVGTRYLISRYLSSCKSGAKLGADCDFGMGGATPNRAQAQDGQPPLLTICKPSDKATSGVQAANLVRSRWRGGQRQNWKWNCLQHGCGEVWAVINAYGSPQGPDTALPKLTL